MSDEELFYDDEYIYDDIHELEKRISLLPKGTLVYKNINGIKQPYLQQTINGKTISKYVKKVGRDDVLKMIELRKELSLKLQKLKNRVEYNVIPQILTLSEPDMRHLVLVRGKELKERIEHVKNYKKRSCFQALNDYLYSDERCRVFILYGLRRTGKTTLMYQAISNMSEKDFNKTAYILIKDNNASNQLYDNLVMLKKLNYKYIFIDEITLLDDFIDGSAYLPDIFAGLGMKIVLSGTDSLGFYLAESDQLFDRTIKVHTTFIPYNEFEDVLDVKGIDNYIYYGGTMSKSGVDYNQNKASNNQYVDSAIAHNIQHSLAHYERGFHFRNLESLYEQHELTSAINRVVEDENHRFTIDVLTTDFKSHDLGISANNLVKATKERHNVVKN